MPFYSKKMFLRGKRSMIINVNKIFLININIYLHFLICKIKLTEASGNVYS